MYFKKSKKQKPRAKRMQTRRKRGGQNPNPIVAEKTESPADEPLLGKAQDVAENAIENASSAVSGLVGSAGDKAAGLATSALSTATHLAEKPLEQGISVINASLSNKELVDQTTNTIGKVSEVASTIVEESTPLVTATIKSSGEVAGEAASTFGKSLGKLVVGAATEIPGANVAVGTLKMADGLFGMAGSAFTMGTGILKTSSGLFKQLKGTTEKSREKIGAIMSEPKVGGSKQDIIARIGGSIRAFKNTDRVQTKKNKMNSNNTTKRVRFAL
jgi:hypothetical protein